MQCPYHFDILTTVALLERLRLTVWQTKIISSEYESDLRSNEHYLRSGEKKA